MPGNRRSSFGCPPLLDVERVDSPFGCQAFNDAARELIAASPARRDVDIRPALDQYRQRQHGVETLLEDARRRHGFTSLDPASGL